MIKIGDRILQILRLTKLPIQSQEYLQNVFTKLWQILKNLQNRPRLFTLVKYDGNLRYFIGLVLNNENQVKYFEILKNLLNEVPQIKYSEPNAFDIAYVKTCLNNELKYIIWGNLNTSILNNLTPGTCIIVYALPLNEIEILHRINYLEKVVEKYRRRFVNRSGSVRSVVLEIEEHLLNQVQHEISKLRHGLNIGTWLTIILTNNPSILSTSGVLDNEEPLSIKGTRLFTSTIKEIDCKSLNRFLNKFELPFDVIENKPEYLDIPTPRYCFWLTSEQITNVLRIERDYPGVKINVVLPPKLSCQEREGELFLGYVIDYHNFKPVSKFNISINEFSHIGIFGTTGSGKTVTGQRICREFVKIGGRVIIFDWKFEWRRLLTIPEARRKMFYEVGTLSKYAIKLNLLRPPPGMDWKDWFDKVITWFAITYGLGPVQVNILRRHLWDLYVTKIDRGEYPTLNELYDEVKRDAAAVKIRSEVRDSYERLLFRLWTFGEGPLSKIFNRDYEQTMIDYLGDYDVIDIECAPMSDIDKPFIIGLMTFQLYYYASINRRPYIRKTLFVIEEAHRIVKSSPVVRGEEVETFGPWGKVTAMARAYNLYLMFIIQTLKMLSPLVLSNLRILIVHALQLPDDVNYCAKLLSGISTTSIDEIARYIPYQPIGHAIIKIVSGKLDEPRLVKIEPITLRDVPDEEIEKYVIS